MDKLLRCLARAPINWDLTRPSKDPTMTARKHARVPKELRKWGRDRFGNLTGGYHEGIFPGIPIDLPIRFGIL